MLFHQQHNTFNAKEISKKIKALRFASYSTIYQAFTLPIPFFPCMPYFVNKMEKALLGIHINA